MSVGVQSVTVDRWQALDFASSATITTARAQPGWLAVSEESEPMRWADWDDGVPVDRHVGSCRDCGFETVDDASYDGYKRVFDRLCRHIDAPGATQCDAFRVTAVYEDGGELDV